MSSATYAADGCDLVQRHEQLLIDSGLDANVARERGYNTIADSKRLKELGFQPKQLCTPALLIPVYGLQAQIIGYQLRPDDPRVFDSGMVEYEMASTIGIVLDVHPRLTRGRSDLPRSEATPDASTPICGSLYDARVPLFITNEVRKADCMVSVGFCCISLVGVRNWPGGNEANGKALLPDFGKIIINNRAIYVVCDRDVVANAQIYAAFSRLSKFLESRGALITIIDVGKYDGTKLRLDEFITNRKTAGFQNGNLNNALLALGTDKLPPVMVANRAAYQRPTVLVEQGRLPWVVDKADEIVAEGYTQWHLFQRSTLIVRTFVLEAQERDKATNVYRPRGAVILQRASIPMLEDVLTRAVDFRTPSFDEEPPQPIDCPSKVAAVYLSRAGTCRLPNLLGFIEAPVLRPNGSILSEPGYDKDTGLLLYSHELWPSVADRPTRHDVDEAVRVLLEPLKEFPFVSEADLSVPISGILTGLQRRLLFSAPLHANDAPHQGSGKSLLADCIALSVTGRNVASMPSSDNEEEMRKKITSVLAKGDLIISIDNINQPLKSDALAMVLTQPTYTDRLLGGNVLPELPTNVLFLATGNNLVFSGDMPTRTIVARIDPRSEKPEQRHFAQSDLRSHVLRNRTRLVRAALTIVRGYYLAGRPLQKLSPFGRFEQWSDEIRSAIVWAGLADPCKTRERITAQDPERSATGEVLLAWHGMFGSSPVTIKGIVEAAETEDDKGRVLKAALLEIAADFKVPEKINGKRLASWCRGQLGRVVGELCLHKSEMSAHGSITLWRVVKPASDDSDASYHPKETLGRFQSEGPTELKRKP
jgi:hypothetical protein